MDNFIVAIASAFWLGILTSISPCPLATNIAAISFIGNRVGKPGYVITAGLLYTVGRSVAYVAIGIILVASLLSSSQISMALQHYLNQLLGPILIVVGMVMLGLINLPVSGTGISESFGKRLASFGVWGAGLLGILFALSFCPLSATLFFGSLIPLSLKHSSSVIMPLAFGIGTALPVIVFAGDRKSVV